MVKTKNNVKSASELANFLLEMLMFVKIYHWKTYSYAEHKATDELYERLNENIDRFIEVLLGKIYDKRLNMKNRQIKFQDPSTKKEYIKIIEEYILFLTIKIGKYIDDKKDTDLLNIRDEMVGDLNQLLYLFTFH